METLYDLTDWNDRPWIVTITWHHNVHPSHYLGCIPWVRTVMASLGPAYSRAFVRWHEHDDGSTSLGVLPLP